MAVRGIGTARAFSFSGAKKRSRKKRGKFMYIDQHLYSEKEKPEAAGRLPK